MSDTKLTVSMILNSASFTKKMQDVNKQLKLAESEFDKVSAGVDKFEDSMEGLQTKIGNLTTKISLQNDKISKYRTEISSTKKTLSELTDKYKDNKEKLEQANAAYDDACEQFGKNSKEAKALKEEITKLEKKQSNYETRIINTNSRLTTLQTELNNSEKEFKELSNEIDKASKSLDEFEVDDLNKKLQQAGDNLKTTGEKFKGVGEGFSSAAKFMAPLSASLIGIGAASISVGSDFEKSMSNVKALSGATGDELLSLENKARELGAATTKSATDAADALGYMALAGFDTNEMLEGLEPILRLSEAGAFDLATASDLATDSMAGLGVTTETLNTYLDQVSQTAANSNTDIQQLMEAFINVGSTTHSLGIETHEAAAALGVMANSGTKGYEAGTKLNSILTRMTAQSSIATKAWKGLGVEVYDNKGNFRGLTTILSETKEKLKDYSDEQAQTFLKAAVGTDNIVDFKNLLNATGGELESLTQTVKDSDGALLDMANTMNDNFAGDVEEVSGKLEDIGITLSKTLMPIISDLLDHFGKLLDWFANLDPAWQKAIIYGGLFTVALNGVLGAVGGTLTSIGNLSDGLGGMLTVMSKSNGKIGTFAKSLLGKTGLSGALTSAAGAGGGLLATLGSFAMAAAPWVAGAAAVAGSAYLIKKELSKEVIPEVDLFADKVEKTAHTITDEFGNATIVYTQNVTEISDATAEAVGAYMELDDGVRESLFNLYANSDKLTKDTVNNLKTQFGEMGNTIKTSFQEDLDTNLEALTTYFANSDVLTEQAEASAILKLQTYYEGKQKKIEDYENQIYEILNEAKGRKEGLTQEEYETITELQNQMRTEAVAALSEQELESQVILERMKSYDERLTAEMVSNNIKELNEKRDKAIENANTTYDETVRLATLMCDEIGAITKEEKDEMIKNAKKQREETIKEAEKTRDGAVEKISDMAGSIMDEVDTSTGDILDNLGKLKKWWENWKPSEKVLSIVNKVSEFITGTKYSDSSSSKNSGKKGKSIPTFDESMNTYGFNNGISTLSDDLYVPTAGEMAAQVRAINTASNPSVGNVYQVNSSHGNSKEAQDIKELLSTVVGLLQNTTIETPVYLDGKQIAKASAKYMETELNTISARKSRLGGAF